MTVIGFLFNDKILKRMIRGTEKKEKLSFYLDLAREKKVDLCLYSLRHIRKKKGRVNGYVFDSTQNSLTQKKVPLPKVNFCRTILHKKNSVSKLKRIEKNRGVVFLNIVSNRQRDKYATVQYLKSRVDIKPHIPEAAQLSYANLIHFLQQFGQIIIKPKIGSLGEGLYKLEEDARGVNICRIQRNRQKQMRVSKQQLKPFYQEQFPRPSLFFIQQWIESITYKGKKMDFRTSVQKNARKKWTFTGIVPRVAGRKKIATNVAQGGRAVSYKKVKPHLPKGTKKRIRRLSLQIAKALEKKHPSTADLGLDIVVDQNGDLWFLEANYRDQRISYRDAGEMRMWKATYRAPFEYTCAHDRSV